MKHLGTVITALQPHRLRVQEMHPEERGAELKAPLRLQIERMMETEMTDAFFMAAFVGCSILVRYGMSTLLTEKYPCLMFLRSLLASLSYSQKTFIVNQFIYTLYS